MFLQDLIGIPYNSLYIPHFPHISYESFISEFGEALIWTLKIVLPCFKPAENNILN